jgi:hypothetical protein
MTLARALVVAALLRQPQVQCSLREHQELRRSSRAKSKFCGDLIVPMAPPMPGVFTTMPMMRLIALILVGASVPRLLWAGSGNVQQTDHGNGGA